MKSAAVSIKIYKALFHQDHSAHRPVCFVFQWAQAPRLDTKARGHQSNDQWGLEADTVVASVKYQTFANEYMYMEQV